MKRSGKTVGQLIVVVLFVAVTLVPARLAFAADADKKLEILRQEVASIAKTIHGDVGASVAILGENPIPLINGDKRFPFMSTVKTLVAIQALKRVEEGKFSLDQQITILPEDLTVMTPINMTFPEGPTTTTLYNLIWTAIVDSDNTAPGVLMRIMDGPKGVEKFWNSQGVKELSIDHNLRDLFIFAYGLDNNQQVKDLMRQKEKEPGGMWAFFESPLNPNPLKTSTVDRIAPNEMVRALSKFLSGEILDKKRTDVLVSIMEQTRTGARRIKGMLPPGTVVGHKTGTGHNYIHDTGFVRLPDGRVMVIAIYTDSVDPGAMRESVIAQIARSAYDYMLYAK